MKRVIIADDSGTARMFVKKCLQIVGLRDAEFIEASDGQAALSALESAGSADLIVTDVTMHPMSGYELIECLKADTRWDSIPILVVTSASNPAQRADLLSAGANEVLGKPISPATLSKAVQALAI